MKYYIATIAILSVVASAVSARADVTIGVNLSTTGAGASLGIPEKNSMSFAPAVIAGEKIRYVIYDDGSDTTTAVQNVKRLISEQHIDLLIGPSITPNALAVVDTIAEAKTPMLAIAQSKAIISPTDGKRRWAFKIVGNDEVQNGAVVNHMAKKGVKTVSVIAADDPYGEGNTQAFKKLAEQKGIKILTVEKYKRADTSATAQALHAMQGTPDAVYIVGSGTPAAMPHVALVERGYKGKIYQTGGVANADFLRVGGKAVEGCLLPASPVLVAEQLPNGYPTKPEALKFLNAYESKFGPRSTFAAHAWDTLMVMEAAIQKALKNAKPGTEKFREDLRTAIEETNGLVGAMAVYTLSAADHSGVNQLGMAIVRIENGKWKLEDHAEFK